MAHRRDTSRLRLRLRATLQQEDSQQRADEQDHVPGKWMQKRSGSGDDRTARHDQCLIAHRPREFRAHLVGIDEAIAVGGINPTRTREHAHEKMSLLMARRGANSVGNFDMKWLLTGIPAIVSR